MALALSISLTHQCMHKLHLSKAALVRVTSTSQDILHGRHVSLKYGNLRNNSSTNSINNDQYTLDLSNTKPFSAIPGPERVPFLGSLLPFKTGAKKVDYYHEYLREMYEDYGPLVREDQGQTTIIHVFNPEDISNVYSSTTVPYVAPLLHTAKQYKQDHNFGLGLGNMNGDDWVKLRSFVNKFTMKVDSANSYIPDQDEVAKDAVKLLSQKYVMADGTVPEIENLIDRWIFESLGRVVGGVKNDFFFNAKSISDGWDVCEFSEANKEVFRLTAALKLSTGATDIKMKELRAAEDQFYMKIQALCSNLIKQKQNNNSNTTDLSIMNRMMKTETDIALGDITTVFQSLLTDGFSTTAPVLLGALHVLALSPEVQEVLYEEAMSKCPPDEAITAQHINKCTNIRSFLKEALRIYPVGDSVQRLLTADMVLSGYHVPAGTRLDLNQFIWLHDPEVFPDPYKVILGRWSRPPSAGVTNKFHPIINTPFSHGVRTCAGRRLADHDMFCFIARLVQQFTVSLREPKAPRQIYRVLLRPETPIPFILTPRNSAAKPSQ